MANRYRLRLPSLRDWGWLLALLLAGAAAGFGLNRLSPVGINLTIALGLDEPAPAAQPAPGAKP